MLGRCGVCVRGCDVGMDSNSLFLETGKMTTVVQVWEQVLLLLIITVTNLYMVLRMTKSFKYVIGGYKINKINIMTHPKIEIFFFHFYHQLQHATIYYILLLFNYYHCI